MVLKAKKKLDNKQKYKTNRNLLIKCLQNLFDSHQSSMSKFDRYPMSRNICMLSLASPSFNHEALMAFSLDKSCVIIHA